MEHFLKIWQSVSPARSAGDPTKHRRTLLVLLFWLSLWQIGAWAVGSHILLAGPLQVVKALTALLPSGAFWRSVATSFGKIGLGFLAAFFSGILVGWLAFRFSFLQVLLAPAITFMNSVPLASFIILALIWTGSEDLAVLTAYLVVFPMIYVGTIAGLRSTDRELLEMAQVFRITGWRKLAGLYWPALLPYLASSCKTALGMSWKAGIAAEVIGVPSHTIGEQLYLSKIYLSTAELFAWTFTIIMISLLSEKAFLFLLEQTGKRLLLPAGRTDRSSGNSRQDGQPLQTGPVLTVTELDKSFDDLQVLRQVSFSASPAHPCCIMGPSGSGKTTLFRILLGLEKPDAGNITLDLSGCQAGHGPFDPSAGYGPFSSAAIHPPLSSAVFQEDRLCISFSPIDNIRLAIPGLSTPEICRELTKILPEECLTRPVATLSGGMKRRTAIARALLAPSDMIVMDEPFTGLDDGTRQDVIRFVLEKSAGRLLLLSTHQREDVELLKGELTFLSRR